MTVDCIIVANHNIPGLKKITQRAIRSLSTAEKQIEFNVILVLDDGVDFNYNKLLCKGISKSNSEWVILANNDLVFHPNFMTEILKAEKTTGAKSFSPWNPNWHEKYFRDNERYYIGYRIGKELCGWMLVTKRETLEQIDFCNERNSRTSFWFADNCYADILIENEIKHCLVRKSKVTHLLSQTLKRKPPEEIEQLTRGQKPFYDAGIIR